jgi:Zn finger protein HypA/HybF involved in hydrogenase expression
LALNINMKKLSHEEFIKRSNEVHNYKYEYIDCYEVASKKLKINCPSHGVFLQSPKKHMIGRGCPKCKNENLRTRFAFTHDDFLQKSKEIHNNFYSYPKDEKYVNNLSVMTIICPLHGHFFQSAAHHLRGSGCPSCGAIKQGVTLSSKKSQKFIERATQIHDGLYEYEESLYIKGHSPIIIRCKKHGIWNTTPSAHLWGYGCPKCSKNGVSKAETIWLDSLCVPIRQYRISHLNITVDGYCPDTNTIYEFHGSFWHGNPKKFDQNSINPVSKVSYGNLFENTKIREKKILDAGFQLIVRWEH